MPHTLPSRLPGEALPHARTRKALRIAGGLGLALAVTLGTVVSAHAAPVQSPAPDSGPVSGGTTVTVPAPLGVDFTQVAVGQGHSLGLDAGGRIWSWGANHSGQLGDGTQTSRSKPEPAPSPNGVSFTQVSASEYSSVALGSDGDVYAWGALPCSDPAQPALSLPRTTMLRIPAPTGITFTQVAASNYSGLALGSDGKVYHLGATVRDAGRGPELTCLTTPTAVSLPAAAHITKITAGSWNAFAVDADGTAYAWGYNYYGQLGDGSTAPHATPVVVAMPTGVGVTDIASGGGHTLAVGSDGKTYSWGRALDGVLGDPTSGNRSRPGLVAAPTGVRFASVYASVDHSGALTTTGELYSWGILATRNSLDGAAHEYDTPTRMPVPDSLTLSSIALSDLFVLGVAANGHTYGLGDNSSGQLGDGTTAAFSASPVQIRAAGAPTGVSFDGVPGTRLSDNRDGTVSIVTPKHVAGSVDVALNWSIAGQAQPPVLYRGGFTYLAATTSPTVTDPSDRSVTAGSEAIFSVNATGTPDPRITWQVSFDSGKTWSAVAPSQSTRLSADGRALTVIGNAEKDGSLYRAIASNPVGSATSANARLSVVAPGSKTDSTTSAGPGRSESLSPAPLAVTGTNSAVQIVLWATGGVLLLGSAGLLLYRGRRRTR